MSRWPRALRANAFFILLALAPCLAAQTVTDDAGRLLRLAHPAQRIVSLSPGITELLFAIGVGDRVIAASEFSDYPAAARLLPRVSRAQGIDLEKIAALEPDLVVLWGSGYPPALQQALQALEVPTYVYEPSTLESIASSIERLGALTASASAPTVAADFRSRLNSLRQHYAQRAPVRVFYQVWSNPIMTLSGRHLVSEVMRTCGARNVFEALRPLVATVDIEAVIAAQPQVIIATEVQAIDRGALDSWRRYPQLPAVANHHLVTLDADELDRAAVRILDAATELCEQVEQARDAARP